MTQIPFNPTLTSSFTGAFDVTSIGLVQGDYFPDPAIIYKRANGILKSSETLNMYGGVGLFTNVPGAAGGPSGALGTTVGRATSLANLLAFSVFSYAMINTPQSPVPQAGINMQVQYFRLGSGARVILACDPILASLQGGLTNAQVSWDFTNQLLVPYLGTLVVSSGTYNSTTGLIVLTMAVAAAFSAGASVTLAGLTGTGAYASLDGTWTATAVSGTTVTLQGPTGLGAAAITGGNATVGGAADQALNVQVLDVVTTNCMTVNANPATGGASWNTNGSAAVVLI